MFLLGVNLILKGRSCIFLVFFLSVIYISTWKYKIDKKKGILSLTYITVERFEIIEKEG